MYLRKPVSRAANTHTRQEASLVLLPEEAISWGKLAAGKQGSAWANSMGQAGVCPFRCKALRAGLVMLETVEAGGIDTNQCRRRGRGCRRQDQSRVEKVPCL